MKIAADHELKHKAAKFKAEDSVVACHLAMDTYVSNVEYSQLHDGTHTNKLETSNR